VVSELDFGEMGAGTAGLELEPDDVGTRVTWTFDTDLGAGPVGRYFGLILDGTLGKDYEKGLARLKTVVEKLPDVDIAGLAVEQVTLAAEPSLCMTRTTAPDPAAIQASYAEAYAQIGQYMGSNRLKEAGPAYGVDLAMDRDSMTFDACIPIVEPMPEGEGDVQRRLSYAGSALKMTHVGSYATLPKVYEQLGAYAAAHAYSGNGPTMARYLDDPERTPETELRTEIYWPIKPEPAGS
jgi:effector-binding domain-containing protein